MLGRRFVSIIRGFIFNIYNIITKVLIEFIIYVVLLVVYILLYLSSIKRYILAFVSYIWQRKLISAIIVILTLGGYGYNAAQLYEDYLMDFDFTVTDVSISQGSTKTIIIPIVIPINVTVKDKEKIWLRFESNDGIIIEPEYRWVDFEYPNECKNAYFKIKVNSSTPRGNHTILCIGSMYKSPAYVYKIFRKDKVEHEKPFNVTVTPNNPPCIINISPNIPNSFCELFDSTVIWNVNSGSNVLWNTTANDPDDDGLLYKYSSRQPETGDDWVVERDWFTDSRWMWLVPSWNKEMGELKVEVCDQNHNNGSPNNDSRIIYYRLKCINNQTPAIDNMDPDKPSPQNIGINITWTVDAKDPEKDPIYYKFFLIGPSTGGSWEEVKDWSTTNFWEWVPSKDGDYEVKVWIRDGKHAAPNTWDAFKVTPFTVNPALAPNLPPKVDSLTPDKASPQNAGTTVVWTASSNDTDGDTVSYRFFIKGPGTSNNWVEKRGWSPTPTWPWTTTAADEGNNQVKVWIRDGNHAATNSWDDAKVVDYVVTGLNLQPVFNSLTPNPTSPQNVGATIRWTSDATDPDPGDVVQYKFHLRGPSTGGAWQVVQEWSTKNWWDWKPSQQGDYDVNVWIRDGKHEGPDSWDAYNITDFVMNPAPAPNQPAVADSHMPNPASPQNVGEAIKRTPQMVTQEQFVSEIKNKNINDINPDKMEFNNPLGQEYEVWRFGSDEDINKSIQYKFSYEWTTEKSNYIIELYLDEDLTPIDVQFIKDYVAVPTIPSDRSDQAIDKLSRLTSQSLAL